MIELFSLGLRAEMLRVNNDWKSLVLKWWGHFGPKFQVEGDVPYQPFFASENKMNWPSIWYKNVGRSFIHFVIVHTCDRQTDRRTDRRTALSWLVRACIAAAHKNVLVVNDLMAKIQHITSILHSQNTFLYKTRHTLMFSFTQLRQGWAKNNIWNTCYVC